jgi:HEAT repeat protein
MLAYHGGDATGAIDALAEALKDKESYVRMHANRALGQIGPPARRVLPALEAIQNAGGRSDREVTRTIRRIRGERDF